MNIKTKPYLGLLIVLVLGLLISACNATTPDEASVEEPISEEVTSEEAEPEEPASGDAAEEESSVFAAEYPPPQELITIEGATTTESGLQYLEVTHGDGAMPEDGDLVTMHVIATLPDGTEILNTHQGDPAVVVYGQGQLFPGWEEGVGLMNAGGSATLVIPPDLAFGEEGYGIIPPNSQIIMDIELLSAEAPPQPAEVSDEDLTTTDSGLQYYDINAGEGDSAEEGNTVTTHYTLWVQGETENEYIVSSYPNQALTFTVGAGDMVFPGWDEGVQGMQLNGKRLLVVPPELALGEEAQGAIPANSTLIMEIELIDIYVPPEFTEVDRDEFTTTDTGLQYYDFEEGEGERPKVGQTVVVHYTGWLEDGTMFDSSVERGQPFTFVIGQGQVIPGWDEGVLSMKIGGKRQLIIPSDLAYGDTGAGSVIPPGATLIFEVELVDIQG